MDRIVDLMMAAYGGPLPYVIAFAILLACGLGIPLPEDITLIACGMAAYYGVSNVFFMIVICFFGIVIGDSMIFFLGAKYGRKITRTRFFGRFLTEARLEQVRNKFHEKGNKLIFAARFMPGLRAPTFFSAGTLHLPFRVFIFYDGMAALLSVPAIILAVYFLGDQIDLIIRRIQNVEHGIIVVILGVAVFGGIKWYLAKRKSRQSTSTG